MKNEVWVKVEQIFHTALNLPSGERTSFLRRECADDAALFFEIESLLKNFDRHADFLDEPVFELGLAAIDGTARKNLSGATIGYYELREKIGAGGMGDVYKAIDTRLNRPVALKFLSESLENDHGARRRLLKEAQAVAMLEHPNICAVHGIEQSGEQHFIVMQFIDGKTLAESLDDETLTLENFRSLAQQIVSAVAFAHAHGVIHRDLKPGNIMLTPDGQIKVLDFGLAKVLPPKQSAVYEADGEDASRFSQNGLIVGTVSYMSPEQLRGEKLDYRSDIFNIGIVLYELLTKQNPFKRASQAETIAATLHDAPAALRQSSPAVPENVLNLIEKCLRKNPEERFQSAAEILVELDKTGAENNNAAFFKRFGKSLVGLTIAAFLLVIVFTGAFFYSAQSSRAPRTLAVLPISFENPPVEKAYLADGLTRSIIDQLSNLSGLRVKNESVVERYKAAAIEPQAAGRELNVDAVYAGSITRRGDALLLTTKLVRTSDGFELDKYETEIKEADLIDLQEKISVRIVSKIKSSLTHEDKNELAVRDTENSEAKQLYLQGRYYLGNQESRDLKSAERCFRDAVGLDTNYAKAWAGLAYTYSLLSVPGHKGLLAPAEAVNSARIAANRAIDIDGNLSEPYVSLGMIKLRYEWEWDAAEENFRTAIRLDPESSEAHLSLSNLLILKKDYARSAEEARRAQAISPHSPLPDLSLARTYYFERRYEQMDEVLSEALERFPNHNRLSYLRSLQFLATGKFPPAIEMLEKIYRKDKVFGAAPLGLAYAKSGRKREAREILAALEEISKKEDSDYVPAQEKAIIHLGLGETDKAFEYLNKSCLEKFPAFPFVATDPIFDDIRTDSRFAGLTKCAGL